MKWILCEDRLPKNDDWEIITILDEHGDTPYRYSDFGWYFDTAKCWIVDAQPRTDVIAWMPLPPPYKADRKTEKCSEIPNNCETCKYGEDKHRYAHICNECGVGINNYEPKTEPQTCDDCIWNVCNYNKAFEDEPQKERSSE